MPYFEDAKIGQVIPMLVKGPIKKQHLVEWCAAENDYYHLHYDDRVAERMGFSSPPIQGTYKLALFGQLLQRWLDGRGILRKIECAYHSPNFEGDTLTCNASVRLCSSRHGKGIVELDLWIDGRLKPSTTGLAIAELPLRMKEES